MNEEIKTTLSEEEVADEQLQNVAGGIGDMFDLLNKNYNSEDRVYGIVVRHKGTGIVHYGIFKYSCGHAISSYGFTYNGESFYDVSKETYMRMLKISA